MTVAAAKVGVSIVNVAGAMTSENDFVVVCAGDPESLTAMTSAAVPGAVGVPAIVPLLAKLNPAGRLPDWIDQVSAPVPPDAASVAL